MEKPDSNHVYPDFAEPVPEPGDGVFETMLVVDGEVRELTAHLARLSRSVHELYALLLPNAAPQLVVDAAKSLPLARLRLNAVPTDGAPALSITSAPIGPEVVGFEANDGRRLAPVVTAVPTGAHKWIDRRRLEQIEASIAPSAPLLVTADERILETSRANVFAVFNDTVTTPKLDGAILPGVTREAVLAICRDLGIECGEANIALDDFLTAEEAFTTGSLRGVEAVGACASKVWHTPGPVTTRIAAELRRRWALDLAGEGAAR